MPDLPRPHALIGHSGFVGGNLARQHAFDDLYNSTNVEDLRGTHHGLLVCAGAPAAKWKANADPDADRRGIERLMSALDATTARLVVLISTIDVFPRPVGVAEDTVPNTASHHAYGRHRRLLEQFVQERFESVVIRLPALYGRGLRKNAVHDLLHDHELEKVDARGRFQFYGLDRLWADVDVAVAHALPVAHLAIEPVTIAEIARHAFGIEFTNELPVAPAAYDMWTRHAALFGGRGHYLETRDVVLDRLADFVRSERERLSQVR